MLSSSLENELGGSRLVSIFGSRWALSSHRCPVLSAGARMSILGSPDSPASSVTCRLKTNTAATSPVITTTCASCRSSSTTTWARTCSCLPQMGHLSRSCSAGPCRDSMPQWTSDQVGVCNHSQTQLRPCRLGSETHQSLRAAVF